SISSRLSTSPRPPRSPLFPYTTLFRSNIRAIAANDAAFLQIGDALAGRAARKPDAARQRLQRYARFLGENGQYLAILRIQFPHRSEEHTSELQSRENLVCRLLLEKKKR